MEKLKALLTDDHVVICNSLKQILAETENIIVAGEAVRSPHKPEPGLPWRMQPCRAA